MTLDQAIVFAVLGGAIALFVSDRVRLDLVAIVALVALALARILEPAEALAGFADPLVAIVAGLFVVGAGLLRTGVAAAMGEWLGKIAGTQPLRLLITLMVVVAVLSAFMSSTGTVAILLPVTVALARKAGMSPSKLLIPLAVASLMGGMLTLIGTPPNLVVSQHLADQGHEPFGFFAFTPIGLVMLVLAIGFMALVGRRLLPERAPAAEASVDVSGSSSSALAREYGLPGDLFRLRVRPGSPLIGRTVAEAAIRPEYGVELLELRLEDGTPHDGPHAEAVHAGDQLVLDHQLIVHGPAASVSRLASERGLDVLADTPHGRADDFQAVGQADVVLTPRSRLVGKTLRGARFSDLYGLNVLGLLRRGRPLTEEMADQRLRFGDALLVQGDRAQIKALGGLQRDFVVISDSRGDSRGKGTIAGLSRQAMLAMGIMVTMLVLMTAGVVPIVVAVLLAACAMVATRCLTMDDAYRSMNWQSIVLIAAMLPMATALDKTGGMTLVVDALTASLGQMGPYLVMAVLFVLTSVFSQFISNTATTVLLAPIAFQLAVTMAVSPRTFLMCIAIAASTAFATPIASPVNTLVMSQGGYRFTDYTKVGVGLQLIIGVATVLLVPVMFPL